MPVGPLRFDDGALELLDQTLLPGEERWLRCERPEQVADAIRRLAVRGAPAIGVACAYGLALAPDFEEAAALLGATRPTAVNLHWAIEHGRAVHESGGSLLEWARDVERAQLEADRRMADYAAALLSPGSRV